MHNLSGLLEHIYKHHEWASAAHDGAWLNISNGSAGCMRVCMCAVEGVNNYVRAVRRDWAAV